MAVITETIARKLYRRTLHLEYHSNGCAPVDSFGSTDESTFYHVSPARPSRRAKPLNPVFSPTNYGSFTKRSEISRHEQWIKLGILSCSGKSVPVTWTRDYYSLAKNSWVWPSAPIWEIDMRNKIKNDRISMADTIGEWRETAEAVEGGAKALQKAYNFVKKLKNTPRKFWPKVLMGKWRRRKTLKPDDINTIYLVTTFGVLPWMNLAQDAIDALNSGNVKPPRRRFTVTKKAQRVYRTTGKSGGELVATSEIVKRAVLHVRYKPNLSNFTSGNIAEALWAGVPLSFMVDWFISVGDWLSAIDALDGVESIIGTVTTHSRGSFVDSRLQSSSPSSGGTGYVMREGRGSVKVYNRQVVNTVGMPLTVEWKNSASYGKLISSLAILRNLRSR